jgi:hypothetical protein
VLHEDLLCVDDLVVASKAAEGAAVAAIFPELVEAGEEDTDEEDAADRDENDYEDCGG